MTSTELMKSFLPFYVCNE